MNHIRRFNAFAVSSFVFGIVGIFASRLILIPIFAVVFGLVALNQFDPTKHRGRWMAITGLVLGTLFALLANSRMSG